MADETVTIDPATLHEETPRPPAPKVTTPKAAPKAATPKAVTPPSTPSRRAGADVVTTEARKVVYRAPSRHEQAADPLADAEPVPGYRTKLYAGRVIWEHLTTHETFESAQEARDDIDGTAPVRA